MGDKILGADRRISRLFNLDSVMAQVEIIDRVGLYQINLHLSAQTYYVYDVLRAMAYEINDSVCPAEADDKNYTVSLCLYGDANENKESGETLLEE